MAYFSTLVNKRIQPVCTLVQEPEKAKNDYDDGDGAIMEWLEKKNESSTVFVSFGSEYFLSMEEMEEIAHELELSNGAIMEWLEKKNESSTVFVSFGSEYFLSMEEMEEIAHELELSKVNFIWVVRFPVGEKIRVKDVLPKGFIARVGERGTVMEGWAPQVKILRHSSIGGIVSHCGWNSVLESIEFGVPIMAMPMHLDQPLNARLIEEVGVGVEVNRDQTGRLHREEISRVLKTTVVEEKNGMRFKRKARELSEKITMKKEEEIDEVVGELVSLCGKRK